MKSNSSLIAGLKRFPETIKKNWITILVMYLLWLIPAVFAQIGKAPPFLKYLNFITAGGSGMINPSALKIAGGAVSKSLVLTFIIGTVIPIFRGRKINDVLRLKGYFAGFMSLLKKGLKGLGLMFIGAGVALALHGFMSTDFSLENSFVSFIAMLYAMSAAQKIKIPGVQGLAPGFLVSLVMAYFSWNTYLAGAALLALGLVLFVISLFTGKTPRQTAVLMLVLMLICGWMAVPALANSQVYSEENPGIELVVPNAVTAHEPFEVIIRLKNPNVKKQVNRIGVNTGSVESSYVTKPAEDKDGINYHGEDEIKFTLDVKEHISEPRKLVVNVRFESLSRDASGTLGSGLNLWVSQAITQQTHVVEADLPTHYTYKQEGNDPFKNLYSSVFTENVQYEKSSNVGFGRWFKITMYPTDAEYYLQNGRDAFDLSAYGLDNIPDNSETIEPKTMEAPQELLDRFGATKGALVLCELRETKPQSPGSDDILMDLVHLNYFFFYLKGNTIFRIWGESDDGVFEASAADLAESMKKELYDAMASIRMMPVSSDAPAYPMEVNAYFFPENESAPIVTENTIVASEEAVTEAAGAPTEKGAVAVALASGIFAAAVAGVAAGAMGASTDESKAEDQRRREYQLIISKTVGSNIKPDQNVTAYASVYERIYEENGSYSEQINPSLSEKIEFSSPDSFVRLSAPVMSGDSRCVAFIADSTPQGKRSAKECTITCMVVGPGGMHRQNIVFHIVDEPYVAIPQKLFIWADSGRSFEWSYEPMDFTEPVETVSVSCQQSNLPFEISASKDLKDKKVTVRDLTMNKPFEGFFDSYTCEIEAKNKIEIGRTVFYVVMCHEGITVDFLGGRPQILAKLQENDSGKMVETRVMVRGGFWNEKQNNFEIVAPDKVYLEYEDEKNVFALLDAKSVENPDFHSSDGKAYLLSVTHSLPSMEAVTGELHVKGNVNGRAISGIVKVILEPDRLTYEKAFEKEYLACRRIIEIYMSERFKSKKLLELENAKRTLGLEDLKLFRQKCWGIAQNCIMQDRQQYVMDEAWYDEAIATAEFLVYIGDIAFDLAMGPIGGPIAGFLAAQVKSSFLEVVEIIIKNPQQSYFEIIWEFVSSRIEQTLGSADGLIEVPKATETKKLAIWLTCYVIYRIGFHWWFDKDEDDQPIGLTKAVEAGLQDFVGKGFGVLLGDYIGKCGKGRWPEKISVTDADQDLVNKNVSKATKAGLDALDKAAAKADEAALALYKNLMSYFRSFGQ